MSQSPDPHMTGSLPSTGTTGPGNIPQTPEPGFDSPSGRLVFSRASTRMPVVIPVDAKKQPRTEPKPLLFPGLKKINASRKLDKRLAWYIVSIAGLLTIILGFVFTVPLNNGQQGSSTVAQSIGNLITSGQAGNITSQSQNQGQAQGSTQFTPGYSTSGSSNLRLFSNSSPWNVPIGTNVQLDPNSSSIANELAGCCHVPAMFSYGMPIYTSTASDPLYHVQDNDNTFEAYQPIHIPNDAAPSPGSDKWLFIYDTTKNLIFEMWQANKSGNIWTANTGDVYSPTGDGVLQVDKTPQSGNGASYFGGVITDADIQRGYIDHALSLASQYTSSDWRYPMVASDGSGGDIPMGARLQLDPSVNCAALPDASAGEKMVCKALETYGGYMRDSGGVALSMYFEGEDLNDPNRNPPNGSPGNPGRDAGVFGKVGLHDGQDLGEIPWSKLRVLKAWNSFTALGTTHTPALATQTTTETRSFLSMSIALPTLGEPARTRRWLI